MHPTTPDRAACATSIRSLCLRAGVAACIALALPVAAQTQQSSQTGKTERIADFPDSFPIHMPLTVQGEGPWYRLPLPLAIRWQAAHADLRDLRVFNAEGEALAYGFVQARARQLREEHQHAVKWFPLRGPADASGKQPGISVQRSGDGTLIQVVPDQPAPVEKTVVRGWLLDTSGIAAPLQKLSLDWQGNAEGFQRFRVEASDDLQQWRSWGDGQVARLSFEGERIERREIELPGSRARYLRLTWETPREAPTLTQAVLTSTSNNEILPPLEWSDMIQAERNGDEYQVSLPRSTVLERVRVSVYQPNTLAPVSLFMLDAGNSTTGTTSNTRRDARRPPSWNPIATGLLYRLMQDGKEIRNSELELPMVPIKDLKLRVDGRGGGLGDPVSFRVAARGMEMVFLARGTPPYTLAMGRAVTQDKQLPLAVLVPGYEPDRLTTMGTAQASAPVVSTVPRQTPAPSNHWKKLGLWAVLLLGVGLLGLMAASLLKGQRKAQEPK
ncbi:DUF3999 domain-containing protein [Pigmentiphaga aceris]|uniref:DUF3999 domain-containing protein n=2 Tax=Pigmentiphaga aceris TaxID=1940612 RepID=A0A5C0B4Y6_9BURK|nr:DUF3999 domain-containing protein [Pigmentiphaga aceris]